MTGTRMHFQLFMTFLLCMSMLQAYDIQEISITDSIQNDRSINERISVSLINNSKDSFSFTLPQYAREAIVNGNAVIPKNNTVIIPLSCRECRFDVEFMVSDAVKRDSSEFTFSRTLNFPKDPKIMDYHVKIPPGFVIKDNDADPSIVPRSEISSDGLNIIISWHELAPVLPKRYFIRYYEHEHTEDSLYELKTELEEPAVWVIAIFFLVLGMILGRLLNKRFHTPKVMELIPSSLLNPDEKKVINLLKENKMKLSQKEMVQRLDWSKSKVSAIITNLEYKKIIVREKQGRNYKVELVKKIGE